MYEVYSLYDIVPEYGKGSYVYTSDGRKILDFYGGHAVISVGHSHPHYVNKITSQLEKLGFYSNSIKNLLQQELAEKLGQISGLDDYHLFLVNSGAEANENALKLASFYTERNRILSFKKSFHGRTSAAVNVTDNPKIQSAINMGITVDYFGLDQIEEVKEALKKHSYAAVIIEGIQGVSGIYAPSDDLFKTLRTACDESGTVLILDEVQSGYGRSGRFFAFQNSGIKPDIVTTAKGMGNGFPIGGVLINPKIPAVKGQLGTTFGGNHLACAAGIAVLDVIRDENLVENARKIGDYIRRELSDLPKVKEVRGRGLMIGIECTTEAAPLRKELLMEENIFVGSSSEPFTLRLLPPLTISMSEADEALTILKKVLS